MPEDVVIQEDEILDGKGGDDTPGDPSSPKPEGEGSPGEGVKTPPADGSPEGGKPDDGGQEGSPIPYKRFKQVNDELGTTKTDLEEMRGYMHNVEVFRAILHSKGVTEKKEQDRQLRELGYEVEEEKTPEDEHLKKLAEGLDLKTTDGWAKYQARIAKHAAEEANKPLHKKLSDNEANKWVSEQSKQAESLAKNVFKIEYGKAGKDEGNPATAIGKMFAYARAHPEHARLGHTTLLRLAMSEEGFKLGEQSGVNKEKVRNENLKRSAMEEEGELTREGTPDENWSFEDIRKWHRKHAK